MSWHGHQRRLEIYLRPTVPSEQALLELWQGSERRQHLFRRLLLAGLHEGIASGVIDETRFPWIDEAIKKECAEAAFQPVTTNGQNTGHGDGIVPGGYETSSTETTPALSGTGANEAVADPSDATSATPEDAEDDATDPEERAKEGKRRLTQLI